jgi:hypothetical protein
MKSKLTIALLIVITIAICFGASMVLSMMRMMRKHRQQLRLVERLAVPEKAGKVAGVKGAGWVANGMSIRMIGNIQFSKALHTNAGGIFLQ